MDTSVYEWCKTILPDLIAEGKIKAFDADEGEIDSGWLIDEITELILDEGEMVYGLYWDTDNPGAGAGVDSLHRFRGLYFVRSEVNGLLGPFQSLEEVLTEAPEEFLGITEATVEIFCTELSAEELPCRFSDQPCRGPRTRKLLSPQRQAS